jgi:hypothetical protein
MRHASERSSVDEGPDVRLELAVLGLLFVAHCIAVVVLYAVEILG